MLLLTYGYQSKCAHFEDHGGDVGMKVLTQMGKKIKIHSSQIGRHKRRLLQFISITCGE